MENIVIAVISGFVAIVVAAIGANKLRVKREAEEAQANPIVDTPKLIKTLNETVEAQSRQIEILRGIADEQRVQLEAKDRQIEDLTQRVSNLERLTIEQALIIRELENKSKPRRTFRREDGEVQGHE